jgi:hypothetical protein
MLVLAKGPSTGRLRAEVSALVRSALIAALMLAGSIGAAAALELITPREAALPDAAGINLKLGFRGVSRGPKVLVVSPAPDAGLVRSPLNLLLKFETHAGAIIEPQFVKLIYLKNPAINLTQRVGHLIKADGIEVNNADVPPGTHYIRVEVKDSAGRLGSTIFALMVAD